MSYLLSANLCCIAFEIFLWEIVSLKRLQWDSLSTHCFSKAFSTRPTTTYLFIYEHNVTSRNKCQQEPNWELYTEKTLSLVNINTFNVFIERLVDSNRVRMASNNSASLYMYDTMRPAGVPLSAMMCSFWMCADHKCRNQSASVFRNRGIRVSSTQLSSNYTQKFPRETLIFKIAYTSRQVEHLICGAPQGFAIYIH